MPFQPERWQLSQAAREWLADEGMRHADRVELLIALFADEHGGNAPTYQVLAEAMSDALAPRVFNRGTIYIYVMGLIAEGRAELKRGALFLRESRYSHPLLWRRARH
jgi:hypothetical protein